MWRSGSGGVAFDFGLLALLGRGLATCLRRPECPTEADVPPTTALTVILVTCLLMSDRPRHDFRLEFPWGGGTSYWTLCDMPGCPGEAVPSGLRCILHLNDDERRNYYQQVRNGERFTASGLQLDGPTFSAIVAALPTTPTNLSGQPRPIFPGVADFRETTFREYVDAQHFTFDDSCSFAKANFTKGFIWNGTIFAGDVDFSQAFTVGNADFSNTLISGTATFPGFGCSGLFQLVRAIVHGDLDLRVANSGGIWLSYSEIKGKIVAEGARFDRIDEEGGLRASKLARIDGCKVLGDCSFARVSFPFETTFGGYADMPPAEFGGRFSIAGSTLGSPSEGGRHLLRNLQFADVDLASLTVYGSISLTGSTFAKRAELSNWEVKSSQGVGDTEVSHKHDDNDKLFSDHSLEIVGARFEDGLNMSQVTVAGSVLLGFPEGSGGIDIDGLVATGTVLVRSTNFAEYLPMTLASGTRIEFERCQFLRGGVIECEAPQLAVTSCDARQPLTFLTPLRADSKTALTSLAYSNVENFILQDIDLTKGFFSGVANLDKLRLEGQSQKFDYRAGVPRRLVIQDEVLVRAGKNKWKRRLAAKPADVSADPSRVAAAYRALRKNREDSKDEPGGADFYYGEMEMRRIGASWRDAEKYLLIAYWAISGYGLRALRALVALLVSIGIAAYALKQWGNNPVLLDPLSYIDSALLIVKVAFGLDRAPDDLSAWGNLTIIVARIVLPALLALAVLAVRGRVKR